MKQFPEIRKENGVSTLYVDGKPFIGLGGELHNSSASSTEYMRKNVWPALRPLHVNSVVATVSWEQIEPEQGVFDFAVVDDLIADAGKEGVKLTLIWFGLWKNGASTYVPEWVKLDRKTYWVCQSVSMSKISSRFGEPFNNTISPLCQAAVAADAKAYQTLMKHIAQV
ncbi:MAG: beta-galactosidase, partial [Oscillospiraceae bacterium]|nr:beta-galactosidase [Oscillospiraceae bacterium]